MNFYYFLMWMAVASGMGVFGFACLLDPADRDPLMPFEEFLSLFEQAPPTSP